MYIFTGVKFKNINKVISNYIFIIKFMSGLITVTGNIASMWIKWYLIHFTLVNYVVVLQLK